MERPQKRYRYEYTNVLFGNNIEYLELLDDIPKKWTKEILKEGEDAELVVEIEDVKSSRPNKIATKFTFDLESKGRTKTFSKVIQYGPNSPFGIYISNLQMDFTDDEYEEEYEKLLEKYEKEQKKIKAQADLSKIGNKAKKNKAQADLSKFGDIAKSIKVDKNKISKEVEGENCEILSVARRKQLRSSILKKGLRLKDLSLKAQIRLRISKGEQ